MTPSAKPKRKRFRFGLFALLLVTGVIAAWLPTLIAMRQLPELELEVQRYRSYSSDLVHVDPSQLCIRKLSRVSYGSQGWKYFLPTGAKMEIRFATEHISELGLPNQYDAVKLPEGEHRLYLREFRNAKKDYVKEVYVDDKIVLSSRHPKSWIDNGGTSWSSTVSTRSEAFPLTEPLELKNARYRGAIYVGKGNQIYYGLPDEYGAEGCCLWIAPANRVESPTLNFVSPKTLKFHRQFWGNREGIQITKEFSAKSPGLIDLVPGFKARIVNPSEAYNSISVRPIVENDNDAKVKTAKPELPEREQSYVNGRPGLRIGFSKTLNSPPSDNPSPLERTDLKGAISKDGKTLRIFCHYESYSSGFRSGAKPVIETIFDADHPNRIGLLPRQAADSKPIKAVQIVTTMDARFRRRKMDVLAGDGDVQTVPLPKLEDSAGKASDDSQSDGATKDQLVEAWQTIPLKQIPIDQSGDQSGQMRKLKFTTDVKDFTTATLPPKVDPKWAYEGVPNCQTWLLPLSDTKNSADQDYKVEILQTEQLPTEVAPPATIAIPGGPVIKSVRITIPMPATKPIWLEITPDQK